MLSVTTVPKPEVMAESDFRSMIVRYYYSTEFFKTFSCFKEEKWVSLLEFLCTSAH